MPEDVTRDLKAFTPVVPDRDALLFAAGKAAAPRRWAGWKWLTLTLVTTNALTLAVLFWPRPTASPPPTPADSPQAVEPVDPYRPDPSSYIALQNGWDAPPPKDAAGSPALPAAPLTPRSLFDPRFN